MNKQAVATGHNYLIDLAAEYMWGVVTDIK